MSERGKRNETGLVLTGEHTCGNGWRNGADTTLVVNDLRDFGAIWHVCIVCKGMANASDIGLEGAIALCCMVTCLPGAIAADYEALGWLG